VGAGFPCVRLAPPPEELMFPTVPPRGGPPPGAVETELAGSPERAQPGRREPRHAMQEQGRVPPEPEHELPGPAVELPPAKPPDVVPEQRPGAEEQWLSRRPGGSSRVEAHLDAPRPDDWAQPERPRRRRAGCGRQRSGTEIRGWPGSLVLPSRQVPVGRLRGEGLLRRPSCGRDPLARPRSRTSGSLPRFQGLCRGPTPLCWSTRALARARRPGSSSALGVLVPLRPR
jgi:hypothetical protein